MSTPRKLGVFFCLLGFAAVCVMASVSTLDGPLNGLRGIESSLQADAQLIVDQDAPGGLVTADGRSLSVQLPGVVGQGFTIDALSTRLEEIDGVRSVETFGQPMIAASPDGSVAREPTSEPTPEPAPEPTVAADPTSEPTPEPAPEPTEEPVAGEPTLDAVVAGLDLGAVDFEPGTARFTAQDTAVLDLIADQLQGLSGGPVQVQAHTNNLGDPDVNLLLSQDRADAVVAYLIDRGVDASLLTSRGFGAQAPIADNTTEQGRAANQRVALVVEGN